SYRTVYRLTGEAPYSLFVSTTQNEPDELVSYDIQLDFGDTLERESLGVLAPGEKLEGLLPDENGIYPFIRLDVEAGKRYSVRQWQDAEIRFIVVAGDLTALPAADAERDATNAMTFTVVEDHVQPLTLMVEITEQNAGDPFVFTLTEGEDTLPPEDAVPANPDDDQAAVVTPEAASSSGETPVPAPATCLLTIPGGGMINQRAEPNQNSAMVGRMAGTGSFTVDAQALDAGGGRWWRLAEGIWVRSSVVDETGDCESVPVMQP
ncbi:MAG: hypothetical protein ABI835_19855, partial [Chloroflexota bacterium]